MPSFSQQSRDHLDTSDRRLQELFEFIILHRDCSVLIGHRTKYLQDKAVADGVSKTPWPSSKHNKSPSLAVDVMPWYPVRPHIRWPLSPDDALAKLHTDKITMNEFVQHMADWTDLQAFSGFVLGVAASRGFNIKWGGHFKSFFDGPHYEIIL